MAIFFGLALASGREGFYDVGRNPRMEVAP